MSAEYGQRGYNPANVAITGGSITGITDLAIADGGTGASTAQAATVNIFDGATAATVLATTPAAGTLRRITDIGAASFGSLWVYGSRWSPLNGEVMLAVLAAPVTGIANSETIILQALIPANAWQTNDTLHIRLGLNKSGTTDSCTLNIRIGTAGTTADTAVVSGFTPLTAGNRSMAGFYDIKLTAATSARITGAPSSLGSYTASTGAAATGTTITSAAANALYVTVTIQSSSTNDTVGANSGLIQLVTP